MGLSCCRCPPADSLCEDTARLLAHLPLLRLDLWLRRMMHGEPGQVGRGGGLLVLQLPWGLHSWLGREGERRSPA